MGLGPIAGPKVTKRLCGFLSMFGSCIKVAKHHTECFSKESSFVTWFVHDLSSLCGDPSLDDSGVMLRCLHDSSLAGHRGRILI